MAKYAISQEGVEALQSLASSLVESISSMEESCGVIYSTIEGVSDGLGVYKKDIYVMMSDIFKSVQKGKESVNQLDRRIKEIIPKIELCLMFDEGDSSGGDSDEPPQKVKVLRR